MTQFQHWWGVLFMASILLGCRGTQTTQEAAPEPSTSAAASSTNQSQVCPVPLLGHEKIPGYQPDSVDPKLAQQPIAFVSPTLEGNPRFYLGLLQQPVKFCGTANNKIAKVKLFASGPYRSEEKQPEPQETERPLGEASVANGIWFFEYDFREGRVIDIVAQGYDANDQLVAKTNPISISLGGPDPR